MAQLHCQKHKRYVPYCDDCKAAVKEAEERERSAALQAEVGFPGAGGDAEGYEPSADQATVVNEDDTVSSIRVEIDGDGNVVPAVPVGLPDPWADANTPAEGDDVGDWKPPADRDAAIDETEAAMTEAGEFDFESELDLPPEMPEIPPALADVIQTIVEAAAAGDSITLLIGDDAEEELRSEGRKEVIKIVREYFADSIDTGAFQLLEYLEKRCPH